MSAITDNFNAFFGKRFEEICMEFIKVRSEFEYISNWWGRESKSQMPIEIDFIALNKSTVAFAECKWQNKVNAKSVLVDLEAKGEYVQVKKEKRIYLLFAKSFSSRVSEWNRCEVRCFDAGDISSVKKL